MSVGVWARSFLHPLGVCDSIGYGAPNPPLRQAAGRYMTCYMVRKFYLNPFGYNLFWSVQMSTCILMNMCMIYENNSNKVLVQDKIGSKWSGITFPGGHVDDGESIYESTVREVKEETGLTISRLEQVGIIHMDKPNSYEKRIIFLYKTSNFNGKIIAESNEGRVFWVDINKLKTMQLSPNMSEYLKLFLNNDMIEAYVTPNGNGKNNYIFY